MINLLIIAGYGRRWIQISFKEQVPIGEKIYGPILCTY